jgi:fused signal recognition particle receptor
MALNWFKKKKKDPVSEETVTPDQEEMSDTAHEEAQEPVEEETPMDENVASETETLPENEPRMMEEEADHSPAEKTGKSGLFARLKSGLTKTRDILTTDIDDLFLGKKLVDEEMLEELEERLITADMGVSTTMDIMERISAKRSRIPGPEALRNALKAEILTYFTPSTASEIDVSTTPHVVMVVGVNGVGKTTTIGKLAAHEANRGKNVLIAAADTFRAAAIEQIAIWAERAGADIVRHKDNADPAAVAYDSLDAAISRKKDIVFVDTAGRLHTKVNLMEEIKKVQRTLDKRYPARPMRCCWFWTPPQAKTPCPRRRCSTRRWGSPALR